ncbi:hypothetical protein SLEP1_g39863 [Rubroshorea leprosula]|uniref:Leucine-rich repeat-containing N-terminal plant-type domain-containing protein n=1 Tax=Rubroshorea leprosula TaxID=152421 RepID=A0AAV5L1Z6_9ROSI|nr:hypothetical protein SLEP1_g39863 [Rubroshorea leprosula]
MRETFHAMLVLVAVLFFGAAEFCSGRNTSFSCIEGERESLLKFKLCFNDLSNMLSSWKGNDCCEWRGVGCDKNSGHVVSLQLRGSIYDQPQLYLIDDVEEVVSNLLKLRYLEHLDLSGNDVNSSLIPPSFGLMKQLRYLNLSSMNFKGRIPSELGNLTRLRVLDLVDYYGGALKVDDDIQWISHLSAVQKLGMSGVNLSHASSNLFQVFGMLSSLSWLSLSDCGLKNSHLTSHSHLLNLTFLENIQHLDISRNSFHGSIPIFLQNMTSLTFLDMSGVNLSLAPSNLFQVLGMLPSLSWLSLSDCSLKNSHLPSHSNPLNFTFLENIQHFDISHNSFHGPVPIFLQNMTSLTVLSLLYNQLSGSIPDSIKQLSKLESIDLSGNQLNGSIPDSIGQLSKLESMYLSGNQLSGSIPYSMGQLSKLESMDLSHNQLSGSIPDSIGQLSKLESMDLSLNKLSGSIPGSIGQLSKLESIYLYSNHLNGSIPDSISQLSKLESIYLFDNQLSGSILNSIGQLSKLGIIDLSHNQLSGSIPDSIGQLSELGSIYLNGNQLSGSIPDSIGQLSELRSIYLYDNQLNGSIPDSIGQLSKLEVIHLCCNQLSGSIPNSIGQLSNLRYLRFSSNKLNGVLPNSINKLSNLKALLVSHNSLEGVISEAHFANLFKLIVLDIGSNNLNCEMKYNWRPPLDLAYIYMGSCKFGTGFPEWLSLLKTISLIDLSNASISGPLPESIGYMLPKLQGLFLTDNLLNGSIPKSLCNSKYLLFLDLSKNMFFGSIPNCWKNDQSFNFIDLSSNNLSGLFPNTMWQFSSLYVLHLSNNSLHGELHVELKNLTSLMILDLGENKFSGNLASIVGGEIDNHGLKVLRLRGNLVSGYIPLELCSFSQLRILDLAENNLTGRIPHCFTNFSTMVNATSMDTVNNAIYSDQTYLMEVVKGRYLEYKRKTLALQISIDLSSNNLIGPIPEEVIFLKYLHSLNLSYNHLSGKIPEKIGQMENLESLDFSQNGLSGMIPNSMSSLTKLSHLNLSYNNLSGPIPTGYQLQTLEDPFIYIGNPQLCGAPLLKNCSNDALPPTTTNFKDNDDDALKRMWFYIIVMSGFAIGFWGVVGTLILVKSWRYAYFQWVDDVKHWILVVITLKVARFKKMFNGNLDD